MVFEERIPFLEVFKHHWLFRFSRREWDKKAMGCKAICFPRLSAVFLPRRDWVVPAATARGRSRDTGGLGPSYQKGKLEAVEKRTGSDCLLQYFFFSMLLLFISPPHGECMNSTIVRTDFRAFSTAFAVNPYTSWHTLANCQFMCIFVGLFSVLLKWSSWQKGKHLCTCVLFFPNFSPCFMCVCLSPFPTMTHTGKLTTLASSNNGDHKIDLSAVLT